MTKKELMAKANYLEALAEIIGDIEQNMSWLLVKDEDGNEMPPTKESESWMYYKYKAYADILKLAEKLA